MWGVQRTMRSPSSSRTRRRVVWVAGCWGPKLRVQRSEPSGAAPAAWSGGSRSGEAGVRVAAQHRRESALTIEDGYRHAVALLARRPRPDAVFCGNDLIAYGVHRRCTELGLAVPGELLLFGFDDNPRNAWLAPWLSTVQVPVDQFGPRAAALIDALPARRQQAELSNVLLPFSLVLRGEAAPAGADGTPHRRPPRKKRPTTAPSTQPGGNR